MSVTALFRCDECDADAPDPGDGGHVGFPSLKDSPSAKDGLVSFEYIYRGYLAAGVRSMVLDEIRAWLIEHGSHPVELSYEGEPVGRPRKPASASRIEAEPFNPDSYQLLFVEWSCTACGTSVRTTSSELMVPVDEPLTAARLQQFRKRVMDVDTGNFHRTFGLLDPAGSDMEAVDRFLRRHAEHTLRVRAVGGESWAAEPSASETPRHTPQGHRQSLEVANHVVRKASFPPPLKLAWRRKAVSSRPVRVKDGVVYVLDDHRRAAVALDRNGREIWRTQNFPDYALMEMTVADDCLWLPVSRSPWAAESLAAASESSVEATGEDEIWAVDLRSGRAERVGEYPASIDLVLSPGDFVGRHDGPDGTDIECISRWEANPRPQTRWRIESSSKSNGVLGHALASEGSRLFASHGATVLSLDVETGAEIWRTDLSSLGAPDTSDRGLRLSVSGPFVVYGLQRTVHVLCAETGAVLWSRTGHDAGLYRAHYGDALFLAGTSVFSGDPHERMCLSLSVATGAEIFRTDPKSKAWRSSPKPAPRFTTVPRPTDECVYLGDIDGRLWALSAKSGDPLWVQGLQGCKSSVVEIILADDRLFVTTGDQKIYCFDPA